MLSSKWWNNKASDIKSVHLYSTIMMMDGPINLRIILVYRCGVGKPEGKGPLWRPRRRWVDNIRMDLREVGFGYMDWIGLAQDRDSWRTFVSAVTNLRVPWNAGNFLTSCKPVSCSGRTLHRGVHKYLHHITGAASECIYRYSYQVLQSDVLCSSSDNEPIASCVVALGS